MNLLCICVLRIIRRHMNVFLKAEDEQAECHCDESAGANVSSTTIKSAS